MTKEELIKKLNEIAYQVFDGGDTELAQEKAAQLLCDYISDEDINSAYNNIEKGEY